jgi:hypothetical protein
MADLDVERRSPPEPEMGAMSIFGRSSLCPNCASMVTRGSRRKGFLDQILHAVFFLSPFRCEVDFRVRFLAPSPAEQTSLPRRLTCSSWKPLRGQSFRVIPQIGPLILCLGVAVRTLQFLPLRRKLRLLWNKIVSQIARFDFRVGKALRAILATKIPAWHKRKYAPTI